MKQRLLTALLALSVLLALMPTGALAVETGPETDDSEIIYETHPGVGSVEDVIPLSELPSVFGLTSGATYNESYYNQLDDNSKKAYHAIYNSKLKEGPTKDPIPLSSIAYSDPNPIIAAIGALLYDHPELSWLVNTSWGYGYNSTSITSFYMSESGYDKATTDPLGMTTPDYSYANTEDRAAITSAIDSAISAIGPLSDKSRYEKVKAIYDWICNNIEYWESNSKYPMEWRGYQTAYSALVEGVTVCAGYAKTFKLLCDAYDIPCAVITGSGGGSGTPQGWGPHAWNYVQMEDGKWYAVDSTWGDQRTWISYSYLLVGSDKFNKTHTEGTLYSTYKFAYPKLNTEDYEDPYAPDTIELSYTPKADGVSDYPYFNVPEISSLDSQETRTITFMATLKKNGSVISGRTVEWVIKGAEDGITLTPNSDGTATLSISSSALRNFNPESGYSRGPVITVTAKCSTAQANQEFAIFVSHRTAAFVQIQKDGSAITSDTLKANFRAEYAAKVYDQYGQEMSGQTVTWTATGTGVTVNNGLVTVAANAAAGNYTVTAASGNGSASVTITVPYPEHPHISNADWTSDETHHWHVCEVCHTEILDKAVHTWNSGAVTTPPTYESEGVRTYACTACGQTRTESIERLDPNDKTVYAFLSIADAHFVELYDANYLLPENTIVFAVQYENGRMKEILSGELRLDDNICTVEFSRQLTSDWKLFFLGANYVPICGKASL